MDNISASNALLKAAFVHHWEGRLIVAEALYRQVMEIDPRQPHALSMLGCQKKPAKSLVIATRVSR
jgi:hypothetical protein